MKGLLPYVTVLSSIFCSSSFSLQSVISFTMASETVGYLGLQLSRVFFTISENRYLANHFWSAGMMYQGHSSVPVFSITSS